MRTSLLVVLTIVFLSSCNTSTTKNKVNKEIKTEETTHKKPMFQSNDKRFSLGLNEMQKHHQLSNMRSHLEAVQSIVSLLAEDKYDVASKVAYKQLGSTTEMKLMCASFGNKKFETLGLEFHKSADKMSEVFKKHKKKEALAALSTTINYCTQCHQNFRQ